jgi:ribosomal peptide maturation radical SAM protein 1
MAAAPLWLIFESSRGCWWGEKRACTFCGFNAPGGKYRVKSAGRIIQEMDALASRYGVTALYASDNVMAPDFPRVVLPRLIERGSKFTLFYEVKSGLRESDLDVLTEAGVVEIQPGIESLSTPVLQLMSKGTTALDNIRLLRDGRSRQLEVVWNYLTGIPGERREHYEPVLELIPLIEHLRPPTRWGPLRISRYSPYHRDPDRYGIKNILPWEALQHLFRDAAAGLSQHFTGEYQTEFLNDRELMARLYGSLWSWAAAWDNPEPPSLCGERREDGSMLVRDGRSHAKQPAFLLRPEMTAALDSVSQPVPGGRLPASRQALIESMVSDGLVIRYEGEYLSVVTEPATGKRLRARRQVREKIA